MRLLHGAGFEPSAAALALGLLLGLPPHL